MLSRERPQVMDEDAYVVDLSAGGPFSKRSLKPILACILLGLLCGFLTYLSLPSKWRASGIIAIGQIPVSSALEAPIDVIQSPSEVVEQIILREAVNQVTAPSDAHGPNLGKDQLSLVRSTLSAKAIKNTNLIEISVAGRSQEQASDSLRQFIQFVVRAHEKRYREIRNRMTNTLDAHNRDIKELEEERARLQELLKNFRNTKSSADIAPTMTAIVLLTINKTELQKMMAARTILEERVNSEKIFPTKIFSEIAVESTPYFPNLKVILLTGGFLGLLVGLAWSMFRFWRRSMKEKSLGNPA